MFRSVATEIERCRLFGRANRILLDQRCFVFLSSREKKHHVDNDYLFFLSVCVCIGKRTFLLLPRLTSIRQWISVKPREKTSDEISGQIRHLHRTYQQETARSDESEISRKRRVCHRCCPSASKRSLNNQWLQTKTLCVVLVSVL